MEHFGGWNFLQSLFCRFYGKFNRIRSSINSKEMLQIQKASEGCNAKPSKKPNFCILNSFPAKPLSHPLDCFCKFTGSNPRGLRGCHAFWLWARSTPYVLRKVDQHLSFWWVWSTKCGLVGVVFHHDPPWEDRLEFWECHNSDSRIIRIGNDLVLFQKV